jgi:hypothetical protein
MSRRIGIRISTTRHDAPGLDNVEGTVAEMIRAFPSYELDIRATRHDGATRGGPLPDGRSCYIARCVLPESGS